MLKESDLIEDHYYVSKSPTVKHGIVTRRCIFKINGIQGYVTYCELKGIKDSVKASMKTVSIPSFLRWAAEDVTAKEQE